MSISRYRGKRLLSVPVSFALLFAMAACGAESGAPTGQASPGADGDGEDVNVRFVILGYSPQTPELYQEAIDDFEDQNPGVTITLENVSWDAAHERLLGWSTTGDTPDISVIGPKWLPELIELDAVQPFDPYVDDELLANFSDSLLDPLRFDGQLYSIPEALSTRLMYYRTDLYAEAGYDEPPTTWDEFVEVSQAVNSPPETYGFSLQGSGDESVWYYSYFMLGAGGDFTDAEGNWAINQPANVEALEFMVSLVDDYQVTPPNPTSIDQDTVQALFTSGQAASYWGPPWTLPAIDEDVRPNVGLADYPTKSGEPAPLFIQDSFVLFKNAEHPQEAVDFLTFWNQDEYQVKFNQTESLIPVTISAGEDPVFADDPALQRFVESIPYARSYAIEPGWETVNVALRTAIQEALLGEDPQAALDAAQATIDQDMGR